MTFLIRLACFLLGVSVPLLIRQNLFSFSDERAIADPTHLFSFRGERAIADPTHLFSFRGEHAIVHTTNLFSFRGECVSPVVLGVSVPLLILV